MGREHGISVEVLLATAELPAGAFAEGGRPDDRVGLFDDALRVALAYADAMTVGDADAVDDALFARVRAAFGDDELVELTEVIAWENASARFNRALRVPAQGLWDGR